MQPTISAFFKTRNKRSISPIDLTGDDPSLQHISKRPKHPDTTQFDKWSFTSSAGDDPSLQKPKHPDTTRLDKLSFTSSAPSNTESPQDDTHSIDEDYDEGEESREPSTHSHSAPALKTRKDMVRKPYTPLELQVGLDLLSSALYNHNPGAGTQEKISWNAPHD